MLNIIFENGSLRFTKHSPSVTYGLDQIAIFIERKYVDLNFYMIVKDQDEKIDVVYLKQVNTQNASYYSYVVDARFPVKFKSGPCFINIFGVSPQSTSVVVSSDIGELNIENSIYNFKSQLSILKNFNENGAILYNKMLDLYYGVERIAQTMTATFNQNEKEVNES